MQPWWGLLFFTGDARAEIKEVTDKDDMHTCIGFAKQLDDMHVYNYHLVMLMVYRG